MAEMTRASDSVIDGYRFAQPTPHPRHTGSRIAPRSCWAGPSYGRSRSSGLVYVKTNPHHRQDIVSIGGCHAVEVFSSYEFPLDQGQRRH